MKYLSVFILSLTIPCFAQLENNLLLHYKFDGNALDESENEYHGIPHQITYTEDRFGNENAAALFNGTDSYVNFPNISELKPQLPVTFSFWIRYDSDLWQQREVFNTSHIEGECSGIYFNTQIATNRYGINFGDGSPYYNSTARRSYNNYLTPIVGEWVQVTAVIEGPLNMKIYINCKNDQGEYSGEGGDLGYSVTPGSLGRNHRQPDSPTYYFKGAIDDFMYWDRALEEWEVSLLCLDLGTETIQEQTTMLYPNPASDILFIKTDGVTATSNIDFYDIMGKKVFSTFNQAEINIGHLPNGLYFVKIESDKSSQTNKLIIKR